MKEKNMARKALLYLSLKHNGNYQKILDDLNQKAEIPEQELKDIESKINSKYVTIFDDDYPRALKCLCKMPFVLYYYGDISILKDFRKCIAIIGSRVPDDYGMSATLDLAREVADDYVVVSGMAKGIDAFAHQGAMEVGGKTVAVLGCGIDICYPTVNAELYGKLKQTQLIISEYPNYTEPQPDNFPWRNRIIAGLSVALVVTQANCHSGTSITVSRMLELFRAVCAVPHPYNDDSFCNTLIADGAKLVTCKKDIEDEIRTLGLDKIEL